MRSSLLLLALLPACHKPRLVGEVHIHQFKEGSHPAALFLAASLRAPTDITDTVVSDGDPLAAAGACRLYGPARGAPQVVAIDAGPVRVEGGRTVPRVDLSFANGAYQFGDSFQRGVQVFGGGELLDYRGTGSAAAPAFHGTLRAPMPLELASPVAPLSSKNLSIRWRPGEAERVLVTLVASRRDGPYAIIHCAARDAAGALEIPDSLVQKLPAPPRDLQLEVRRDAIALAPTEKGAVILHASQAVSLGGAD